MGDDAERGQDEDEEEQERREGIDEVGVAVQRLGGHRSFFHFGDVVDRVIAGDPSLGARGAGSTGRASRSEPNDPPRSGWTDDEARPLAADSEPLPNHARLQQSETTT